MEPKKSNFCSKLQTRDKIRHEKQPNIRDNTTPVGEKAPRVVRSGVKKDRCKVAITNRTTIPNRNSDPKTRKSNTSSTPIIQCQHCHSKTRKTKPYIIADNLEEPRYLCRDCKEKLDMSILLKLSGIA